METSISALRFRIGGAPPTWSPRDQGVRATPTAVRTIAPAVPAAHPSVRTTPLCVPPTLTSVRASSPRVPATLTSVRASSPCVPATRTRVPETRPCVRVSPPAVPATRPCVPASLPGVRASGPCVPTSGTEGRMAGTRRRKTRTSGRACPNSRGVPRRHYLGYPTPELLPVRGSCLHARSQAHLRGLPALPGRREPPADYSGSRDQPVLSRTGDPSLRDLPVDHIRKTKATAAPGIRTAAGQPPRNPAFREAIPPRNAIARDAA
ncbi:MAG: hypothetical protein QOH06_3198 [Acidobacteriota bacterium]|nr:hypothetical protein [Acidobacteriota bacterium]